jgi:HYDIN/CFA65/VesB family protein/VCBS repeat protein
VVHSRILVRSLAGVLVAWFILASGPVSTSWHRGEHRDAPSECVLIALPGNSFTFVRPPDLALRQYLIGQLTTATFQVTYVGFQNFPEAQDAFQAAVDVWSMLVSSPVPIKVRAEFKPLGANVLGSASAQFLWRDFPGAPLSNTWYPDALADRTSGSDVNASSPSSVDILANFNSTFSNWYFGTDGATPANKYDFFSVVLHELTHGLGFAGSANVSGGLGSIGFSGLPTAYDRFVVTETDAPILGFVNPSVALGTQLTSGYNAANPRGPGVYWGGSLGKNGNGGLSARLYTPSTWLAGSSYAHLDENTYPAGNPNSLMTYAIAQAEAIHSPGPVALGLLGDSGWVAPAGLIKLAGTTQVYWFQDERRYPVVSDDVITGMQNGGIPGWSLSSIASVPILPGVTAPAFINTSSASNGLLIRQLGTPTVYVIENGRRRAFVSIEALAWNGTGWLADVIDVPATIMATYTLGPGQSVYGIGEGETNGTIKQSFADAYTRLMSTCGASASLGWPGSFATCLEFPQTPVAPIAASGVSGLAGKSQNFGNETTRLGTLVWGAHGTFGVVGGILAKWESLGASGGPLGFPISDEQQSGTVRRSDFEGGFITWNGSVADVVFNTPPPAGFSKVMPAPGATDLPLNLTLGWSSSNGAASYEYCLDSSLNSTCDVGWTSIGAGTAVALPALNPGTAYQWQVRALNSAGITLADAGAWWTFTTAQATRAIAVTGNLAFGNAGIGSKLTRTITISNTGNSALTVTGISYPEGFTGNWAGGTIAAGGSQGVQVTFAPTSATVYGGTVTVQANQTSGTPTVSASGTGIARLITDLDGDGIGDILLQETSSSWVAAWLMNGALQASKFVYVYPHGVGGWKVVGRTDLNGDGIGDILLQETSSSWVAAWLMDSSGQPVSFVPIYSSGIGSWEVVGTADVNADGIADILLQETATTHVAAWLMNASGQVTSFMPIYTAELLGWKVVATADLNSDGITDIVLQDSSSSYVGGWLMNSSGQPVSFLPVYFASTGNWHVVGSEDLNGDGIVDLLLQDSSSSVAVWLMTASGQPASFVVFYPDPIGGWEVKGRR